MKILKRLFPILLLLIVLFIGYFAWQALPIISGYGAKNACSNIFIAGRSLDDIKANELADFPLSLGTYEVNIKDSSVTGTVFGLAKRVAVYRTGLGATLLNGISREDLYKQINKTASPVIINQDSLAWPNGNLITDTIIKGVNKAAIHKAVQYAFNEPMPRKRRTRAVIVVYNGQIIAEKYADGYDKDSKLIGWSMTKSITNALLGILAKDSAVDINAPAPIELWQKDARRNITLKNLMQMSSGLRWEENYKKPSDATNMLYKAKDMGGFAMKSPAQVAPDKIFYYSSGTTNILSHIVRQSIPDSSYLDFPYKRLFYKIGMNSMVMEPDAGGTFVGSSYSFATAKDWARFGLLYLNDGVWGKERILPEGWVKFTTTPAVATTTGNYGAQWWLNAGAKNNPADRTYPDVPTDCFYADGYEGQFVWVIPSKKLVVVRLALEHGNLLDCNKFLSDIVKAVP